MSIILYYERKRLNSNIAKTEFLGGVEYYKRDKLVKTFCFAEAVRYIQFLEGLKSKTHDKICCFAERIKYFNYIKFPEAIYMYMAIFKRTSGVKNNCVSTNPTDPGSDPLCTFL